MDNLDWKSDGIYSEVEISDFEAQMLSHNYTSGYSNTIKLFANKHRFEISRGVDIEMGEDDLSSAVQKGEIVPNQTSLIEMQKHGYLFDHIRKIALPIWFDVRDGFLEVRLIAGTPKLARIMLQSLIDQNQIFDSILLEYLETDEDILGSQRNIREFIKRSCEYRSKLEAEI